MTPHPTNTNQTKSTLPEIVSTGTTTLILLSSVLFLLTPSLAVQIFLPHLLPLDSSSSTTTSFDALTGLERATARLVGTTFMVFGIVCVLFRWDSSAVEGTNYQRRREEEEEQRQRCVEQRMEWNKAIQRINTQRVLLAQAVMGIGVALVGAGSGGSSPSLIDGGDDDDNGAGNGGRNGTNGALVLIIGGVICFTVSCVGLMVSHWPVTVAASAADDDGGTNARSSNSGCCGIMRRNHHSHETSSSSSSSITGNDNVISDTESPCTVPLLSDDSLQVTTVPTSDPEQPPNNEPETTIETNITSSRISTTRRLIHLAGPHSRTLYLGCIVLLIRLPFSISIPHFVSTTLSALAVGNYTNARLHVFYLLAAGSIDALLDFWCIVLFDTANLNIVRSLRLDVFRTVLQQDIAFFDTNDSASLTSRLSSDCGAMGSDLTWFFRFSVESTVRIVGVVGYMFVRSPRLACCAVAAVPLVSVVNKKYGDWLHTNAGCVQTALAYSNAVAQEVFGSVRTVVALATERWEGRRYRRAVDVYYGLNLKQVYATGVYYMAVSTFLINTCVQALLLGVGLVLVERGQMESGVLLAFMLYQGQLQNEVLNLFNSFTSLVKSGGAGEKVFRLLDRMVPVPGTGAVGVVSSEKEEDEEDEEDEDGEDCDGGHVDVDGDGDDPCAERYGDNNKNEENGRPIEAKLTDVTFSYPTRTDRLVLDSLTLTIPAGQTVAIVGPSGCGKSTIIDLLQRLYDPVSGSVTIDGSDLRQLDVKAHRRRVGIVTQEPVLFSGTVRSNILYGNSVRGRRSEEAGTETGTEEEVIAAAKLANAHGFVTEFPDGYETEVGERGVQLSGGQKQRIAIARAIVRKPGLLLLDEATSALDTESEKVVQSALDELLSTTNTTVNHNVGTSSSSSTTCVVVAHRLQTVRNADRIVVIDSGKVREEGTHKELMDMEGGLYRRMARRAEESGVFD